MRHIPPGGPSNFGWTLRAAYPSTARLSTRYAAASHRGCCAAGDQLPTVRQVAVDLAINPNTVVRAYRELEIGGLLETQQGTGTFISPRSPSRQGRSGNGN